MYTLVCMPMRSTQTHNTPELNKLKSNVHFKREEITKTLKCITAHTQSIHITKL